MNANCKNNDCSCSEENIGKVDTVNCSKDKPYCTLESGYFICNNTFEYAYCPEGIDEECGPGAPYCESASGACMASLEGVNCSIEEGEPYICHGDAKYCIYDSVKDQYLCSKTQS